MTIRELVSDVGGRRVLSQILGVPAGTISGWVDRNRVPERWRIVIKEKMGVDIENVGEQ